MGLNTFIKMAVAGWEEFQSYSNSGLIYTAQELAFLPETLKEFTGENSMGLPSCKSVLINADVYIHHRHL